FAGSSVVCLNTHYTDYLLAEANLDLVNLFGSIKQHGVDFIDYCKTYFSEANNAEAQYYLYRSVFNQCTDKQQRAALFLYLNRHGYNGLCRYNARGGYNVPFGRYKKPYFPHKELLEFHHKSQHADIIHADFRETFKKARRGDVIYCDPPYSPIQQISNFSAYTSHKFGEDEHRTLATLASQAALAGIPVIISNHDTAFTQQLYQGAEMKSIQVKRSISCLGGQRQTVSELIAIFHAS
ncbi:MAG: DNA adenine methylase, partial [Legionella sp. 21-45-4]